MKRLWAGALLPLALAACASLPEQGPSTAEIVEQGETADFILIDVTDSVSRTLAAHGRPGFVGAFSPAKTSYRRNSVGVGDVLAIRILEAGSGGLFAEGGGGGSSDFPAILVDSDGTISLPFVGEISVLGDSPREIQDKIVAALEGSAIEPQAVVTLVQSENNTVTLAGDLARPGEYPLSIRGERLAAAISNAGGSRFPAHQTSVTVIRNGQKGRANLAAVLEDPGRNIQLQRDDLIVLTHDPASFTITGSVNRGGVFPFDTLDVSVMEAIGRAGGLEDGRADPTGVFVFRYERKSLLKRLGHTEYGAYRGDPRGVPTVYRINMEEPKAQFYAQSFHLNDSDGVYVSNSKTVQLAKLFRIFDLGLTTVETVVETGDRL